MDNYKETAEKVFPLPEEERERQIHILGAFTQHNKDKVRIRNWFFIELPNKVGSLSKDEFIEKFFGFFDENKKNSQWL